MAKQFITPAPQGVGPHVFIAIPSTDGKLHAPCIHSLMQVPKLLDRFTFFLEAGNCHVDDARNSCVREFLKTDADYLFFIDSDVGFDPAALAKIVNLGRSDIVAGVYPKKSDEEDYPVLTIEGDLVADKDGLVEVNGVPTGFMCIPRSAIELMIEKLKPVKFQGQNQQDKDPYYVLFERLVIGGQRRSGDYAFCNKWRLIGGHIFVDPEIPFVHEGMNEWGGVLGSYWRRKFGVTENRFYSAIEKLKSGDFPTDIFVWLVEYWNNPWSPPPTFLMTLHELAKGKKVIECGSGLSTIVLAAMGADYISLEHDPEWHFKISNMLDKLGLPNNVKLTPLAQFEDHIWYGYDSDDQVGLVVIDGPPRKYGREGVFKHLNLSQANILMDDIDTPEYLSLLTDWAEKEGRQVKSTERFSICLTE